MRGRTRRRLWERRGQRSMETHMALHFLHDLVDVPVQNRDLTKSLQQRERLRPIVSTPAPLRIDHPERNVREKNNRCRRGKVSNIFLHPLKLLRSKISQRIQHQDVIEAHEMDALVVEAVPTAAQRSFAEMLPIQSTTVDGSIVLA